MPYPVVQVTMCCPSWHTLLAIELELQAQDALSNSIIPQLVLISSDARMVRGADLSCRCQRRSKLHSSSNDNAGCLQHRAACQRLAQMTSCIVNALQLLEVALQLLTPAAGEPSADGRCCCRQATCILPTSQVSLSMKLHTE